MATYIENSGLTFNFVKESQFVVETSTDHVYKMQIGDRVLKLKPYVLTKGSGENNYVKFGWVSTAVLIGRLFTETFGLYGVYCKFE